MADDAVFPFFSETAPPTPPPRDGPVSVGIAGWSYPDWDGYVYPPRTRHPLRYIAAFVDMIEINSTFYRPPEARTTGTWLKLTEDLPGFFFTAKLHRDMTHRGLLDDRSAAAFRDGLAPLVRAGKLRHLLAQFKYDVADSPDARRLLAGLRDRFAGTAPLALELRHRSWQDAGTLDFLRSLDVTVVHLDYPTAKDSFDLPVCDIGQQAYFRLHGRNAAAWFDRNAGRDETYNYLYSGEELSGIVKRAAEIKKKARSLTVVANNHYQGKEVVNALQVKAMISGTRVPVPPLLAERYPELKSIR